MYNGNTKRPKLKENQLGILGISSREFANYVGNLAEGLRCRREGCWGYVSMFENFFFLFIGVFNLFLSIICLICWCDNLQRYNI